MNINLNLNLTEEQKKDFLSYIFRYTNGEKIEQEYKNWWDKNFTKDNGNHYFTDRYVCKCGKAPSDKLADIANIEWVKT
jgi:hypothetical protein